MTKGKLCAVAAATFLLLSGWETARAEDATWTITVERADVEQVRLQYPVTYIFRLADMPEDLKVERPRRRRGGLDAAGKEDAGRFFWRRRVRASGPQEEHGLRLRRSSAPPTRSSCGSQAAGRPSSRARPSITTTAGRPTPLRTTTGAAIPGPSRRGLARPHERRVGPLPGVAYGLPQLPPAGQHGHQQPHGRRRGRVEEHAAGIGPRRL